MTLSLHLWRRSPALDASLPLAVLVVLYVRSSVIDIDGYAVAASGRAASAVFLVGTVCSASAAWQAGRFRLAQVFGLVPSRSSLRLLLHCAGPSMVLAVAGIALALIVAVGGTTGSPSAALIATAVAVAVAHALVGTAIGLWLPTVVAVPALLVVTYLWFVYPIAVLPFWIRHTTGFVVNCCQVGEAPDSGAVLAPALLAAALAAAAVVAFACARGRRYAPLLVVPPLLVAGVVGAASLVDHLGPDPVRDRAASELRCAGDAPTVCVWPEHEHRLETAQRQAAEVVSALGDRGVETPPELTEGAADPSGWRFKAPDRSSDDTIRASIATGLIIPHDCSEVDPTLNGKLAVVAVVAAQWVERVVGGPFPPADGRVDPLALAAVDAIAAAPVDEQATWFEQVRVAIATCGPPPATPAPAPAS